MSLDAATATVSPQPVWYAIDSAPQTIEELERERSIRSEYAARILHCLSTLSPEMRAQVPQGGFIVSVYDPVHGGTRMIGLSEAETHLLEALEVVLYGKATADQGVLPTHFYYSPGWPAIFVPAIRMTPDWFCAVFVHEIFHAHAHADHGEHESEYDEVLEEIQAHEMERAVLDRQTNGAYRRALTQALHGESKIDLSSLMQKVESVNALFPPAPSDVELGIRYAQILFDLAFLTLESDPGISEQMKVDLYLALRAFAQEPR